MKKLIFIISLFITVTLISCSKQEQEKEFVVIGHTSQERLNGYRAFVVPYGSKEIEDSIGVDSVEIVDGRFEIHGKGQYLARVTVSRKVRYGTQDLLIFTEPGDTVFVEIDSISSSSGTPQNEAMQKWKELKQAHERHIGSKVVEAYHLRNLGDTARANAISDSLKVLNEQFREQVLDITRILGSGPAYDFLIKRYGK